MSSIAAGANSERTNRWLLIGAAALAVLAGVLIYVALANTSGSSNDTTATKAAAGSTLVLVAKDTVPANTKLTAGMFVAQSVPASIVVINPVANETAVIGKVTRTEIIKGQQLSFDALGISRGAAEDQIAFSIAQGDRGFAVPVGAAQLVAGLIVPDDHVDVIVTYAQPNPADQNNPITRIETVLQNIRVLAIAQTTVTNEPSLNAQGTPIAKDPTTDLGARPADAKPNPGAGTATLELTPDQVQLLTAAMAKGSITLALRGVGDTQTTQQPPLYQDDRGVLPRTPAP